MRFSRDAGFPAARGPYWMRRHRTPSRPLLGLPAHHAGLLAATHCHPPKPPTTTANLFAGRDWRVQGRFLARPIFERMERIEDDTLFLGPRLAETRRIEHTEPDPRRSASGGKWSSEHLLKRDQLRERAQPAYAAFCGAVDQRRGRGAPQQFMPHPYACPAIRWHRQIRVSTVSTGPDPPVGFFTPDFWPVRSLRDLSSAWQCRPESAVRVS
ncbi:hypothetical protein QBC47DRAFT_83710 [Echria macrotheca]|uniref:Uncharacterized protein n=1 Tax=Echria macrotheca TaxID=438768 RepID=A0AAJ0B6G1_9PEZI|nr:hypothetical protein QBC47DRAFT_83710 [Echria macrotheca]